MNFAKGFGFEDLAKLKESIKANIERDYRAASRGKWKRELLDALDKKYAFDLPEGLVTQEFDRSGARSRRSKSGAGAATRTTARPRRRRAPIIAKSPNGGCGLACCWPKSATRRTSRFPTRRSVRLWSSGRARSPAKKRPSGIIIGKIPTRLARDQGPAIRGEGR